MSCPLIGTNFLSLQRYFACRPVQLTTTSYFPDKSEKLSIFLSIIWPPALLNLKVQTLYVTSKSTDHLQIGVLDSWTPEDALLL